MTLRATRAERILQTMLGLDPLADLPRTGWLMRGVRPCESIADVPRLRRARAGSLEARVVKAADKAQMMIKALAYEHQRRGQLDEFWSNAANFDDRGVAVARELFAALAAAAGRELPRRIT